MMQEQKHHSNQRRTLSSDFFLGQYHISMEPIAKLRTFLSEVFEANFDGGYKLFDVKEWNLSCQRRGNESMTIQEFLSRMSNGTPLSTATFQVGSPTREEITISVVLRESSHVEQFAWVVVPFTLDNYLLAARAYKLAFGIELGEVPNDRVARL